MVSFVLTTQKLNDFIFLPFLIIQLTAKYVICNSTLLLYLHWYMHTGTEYVTGVTFSLVISASLGTILPAVILADFVSHWLIFVYSVFFSSPRLEVHPVWNVWRSWHLHTAMGLSFPMLLLAVSCLRNVCVAIDGQYPLSLMLLSEYFRL